MACRGRYKYTTWISHGVTRRPIPPRRNVLLTHVSDLLDPETGGWDELLVRDIFWAEDVKHILDTPTTSRNRLIAGAPFLYHRRFQLRRACGIKRAVSEIIGRLWKRFSQAVDFSQPPV